MDAYRNTALVLLTGFGVYFGVLVPALTMTWIMIPVGVILLVSAAVLAVDTRRERRRASRLGSVRTQRVPAARFQSHSTGPRANRRSQRCANSEMTAVSAMKAATVTGKRHSRVRSARPRPQP